MTDAPSALRFPDGTTAAADRTRVVARLARPGEAGKPVLTERVRARLASLGLEVEGDPGPGGDPRVLRTINHGPNLIWLRATRKRRAIPDVAAVSGALGRKLAWVAPVYRLRNVQGLDALFCAKPDVLLLRATPGGDAQLNAAIDELGLKENFDRSRYLGGWRYLMVPEKHPSNAFELADRFRRQPKGPEAELDYVPLRSPLAFVPDDPMFGLQWNVVRVGAPQAWDISTGDRRVVVAVIDSGCDLAHADLRAAYVSAGTLIGDPTRDGSPIVLSPSGALEWHGTGVAGVIAAGINNAVGISGLAGGCGVLPVAVPDGATSDFAAAIRYAVAEGAHVLNISMSIGSYWFERFVRSAIDEAVAAGCVVCAAAGNGDGTPMVLPGGYPTVMGCGGSGEDDTRWRDVTAGEPTGSSYGDEYYAGAPTGVSVVAPAANIVTTDISGPAGGSPAPTPGGDYIWSGPGIPSFFDATSAATPHVAAAAALVRSAYPALSAVETRRVIERTAEKVGGYAYTDVPGYPNGSRHPEMGHGRLNLFRALDLGDVMIADWPGDDGVEPSSPPGGDFFSFSDVVIRPGDDGVFMPESPEMSSVVVRGRDHTVSVRVRNKGPNTARDVRVDVRATPWAGTEFIYPAEWTLEDALHVRPTPIDAGPFTLPLDGDHIARFSFSAAQIDELAGWTAMPWHPCLVAVATAENDYAFASAPAGGSLHMRRNNLAQRNLSVIAAGKARSLRFPFVIGHPDNPEPRLELIVEPGVLAKLGEVHVVLADASAAFPAALRAKAFATGALKVGKIAGGKATTLGRERAILVGPGRAMIELVRPQAGRYALQLAVRLPDGRTSGEHFAVSLAQRVGARGVTGGATVVFVVG